LRVTRFTPNETDQFAYWCVVEALSGERTVQLTELLTKPSPPEK